MRSAFADVATELADIAREVAMLDEATDIHRTRGPAETPAFRWLMVQGLASGVEKIYTGCERVMSLIATHVDGTRVMRDEGWHVSLLKRMATPSAVRPAVISPACFDALDRLRAFRHRQRNTYGLVLDAEIVAQRAAETRPAFERFRDEVLAFMETFRDPPPPGR
ncbi:hypothetical protein A33M_0709 [Rhodovulum sp. PH10]|uniref:ribonuclease toxin HepT-like protein n=1 Tax=Rhodovulum sp. PH10 TaxID=1187851 RepID=UPI00027C2CB2|nr:hypothetical protein [Rhodovulum sp. PH10]EJW09997.1 hypothetical protein A33M_0709 [Rhodovulum sp. PH10]